jgi:chromate transporter
MRRELVEKRHWLEPDRFARMFAACNLIPGPSSTELAIYIGYRLAGLRGLLAAGICFIAPAVLIMLGLAWIYTTFSKTAWLGATLLGIRPVVVAIIAWAAIDLARKTVERRWLLLLAPMSLALAWLGLDPLSTLVILAAASLVGSQALRFVRQDGTSALSLLAGLPFGSHPERLFELFVSFLKIGSVTFGSGYSLFAFLQSDFIVRLHWLSTEQLADAVAIGQVTPGPVFTTATFLGYQFAGVPGALLGTIAIFLPGFVLVPLLDHLVRLVETRTGVRIVLDAVNAVVIGLILWVGLQLGQSSVHGWATLAIALIAFPVIAWKPLATPAVVVAGALAGLLVAGIR